MSRKETLDDCAKSPDAALRFIPRHCGVRPLRIVPQDLHAVPAAPAPPCILSFRLRAGVWITIILLILQIACMEGRCNQTPLQWTPFQVKSEFIGQYRQKTLKKKGVKKKNVKKKGVKKKRGVLPKAVKTVPEAALSEASAASLPDQLWPNIKSRYHAELSARIWTGYVQGTGILLPALQRDKSLGTVLISDISRNVLMGNDFLGHTPETGAGSAAEEAGKANFKITFFNRGQYINKDALSRDPGRYSSWEYLMSEPSGLQNRNLLDTLGKVFEPKIDLGIEF